MRRVALIVPNTDTTLERDLQRNLGGAHGVHSERVWLEAVTVEAEEAMLRDEVPRAAEYLRPIRPDVAVFGCTSAGALRGTDGEAAFVDWLAGRLDCPVVSAFGSVRRQLQATFDTGDVWLVTPYVRAVHETMLHGLAGSGLSVRDGGCMGIASDIDVGDIEPDDIADFVLGRDIAPGSDDGVFLSCTNLRAAECADDLTRALGCRVTSSNLAILDALQRIIDQ